MKALNMAVVKRLFQALCQKWVRLGSTLGILLIVGFVVGSPVRQVVIDYQPYLSLQVELLSKTPQGQRYINLYYSHLDEIVRTMEADPALFNEGLSVLNLWEPNLRALLDGKGGETIITKQQVQAATNFLDHLSAAAGPELRQTISDERAYTPLEPLAGLTMDQAYEAIIGSPPSYATISSPPVLFYYLTWLPPLDIVAASRGLPHYTATLGSTVPIEFVIQDRGGYLALNRVPVLEIHRPDGHLIVGPLGQSDNRTEEMALQGSTYHYDFRTSSGWVAGSYTIIVSYNAGNSIQNRAVATLDLLDH